MVEIIFAIVVDVVDVLVLEDVELMLLFSSCSVSTTLSTIEFISIESPLFEFSTSSRAMFTASSVI